MDLFLPTLLFVSLLSVVVQALLFPQQSETREIMSLSGVWNFAWNKDSSHGYKNEWFMKELDGPILMPVPSSYNDITTDPALRDHLGVVWYDRTFFAPKSWQHTNVMLRFSSVSYAAEVWINGRLAMVNEIGHLPFEADVTNLLKFGKENRITVACDNTLLNTTIPQGDIRALETDAGVKQQQTYTFDFFNYAGIHRPVYLYTRPKEYIEDISITTDVTEELGIINYNIETFGNGFQINAIVYDGDALVFASNITNEGTIRLTRPKLWWPYLMHPNPGHMHILELSLVDNSSKLVDIYRLPVGIRKLDWDEDGLYVNDKPVYLHGFGRHEDGDIRGKGLDLPTVIRDHELIRWVGGNVYRTSHYPYAEEIMDVADTFGIMIIDECPAVNIDLFSDELREKHKESLTRLVARDKNRPSVIAWSVANEPRSQRKKSNAYFKDVTAHAKSLDITRPITAAINRGYSEDFLSQYLDIISFNRYNAWYQNEGQLDTITKNVIDEARSWRATYKKPVLMSEYGADTIQGFHSNPEYIWSEEFQVTLLSNHFKAFDELRKEGWFIGEFVWNFADFATSQKISRVGGNRKGIFTRQRQPKAAAHHLRKRYFSLANELHNATIPSDLYEYTARNVRHGRDEL